MTPIKLLRQRLAYVPWLLAAGLALGWSGEAGAQTLTARFESMPESHDGSEFTFELHFSEEIEMSYVSMRDDVFDVTGGTVTRARRLGDALSNLSWQITIVPDSDANVSITLPPTVNCTAASAVCTADGRALSSGLAAIVSGLLRARFESMPESHDGSEFAFELHFSEEIEMSYVSMRDDVFDVTGGTVTRAGRLEQGSNIGWEIAIVPEPNADVSITLPPTVDCAATGAVCTVDGRALSSGLAAIVSGPEVTEPEITAEATVQADLKLSVNPASVREDAGETDVEVTIEVTDDTAVDADTYVLLGVSQEGLNRRFYMGLTVLRILAGEKKAMGTLTLIPINDDIIDEDLPIVISGNAGGKTVEPATLTLVDDDKDSKNINLSVDIAELIRFDGETDITVTATLDGKVLNEDTSFSLIIGDHPDLEDDPNTDTDGDGDMDDADATKDNREAQRDVDYTATLATLTIPRKSASGTATITITPRNRLPGTIRVESPDKDTDADAPGIQIADDGLTINPVDIKIKKEVRCYGRCHYA